MKPRSAPAPFSGSRSGFGRGLESMRVGTGHAGSDKTVEETPRGA